VDYRGTVANYFGEDLVSWWWGGVYITWRTYR